VLPHRGNTAAKVARGGYVLGNDDGDDPVALLLATGSEVSLAVRAQELLQREGIAARVVSMPCLEWFDEQDQSYRDAVLPPAVRARVSVEAGATLGWWRYVGDHGEVVGLDHYGASADAGTLYDQFGITAQAVVAATKRSLARSAR